SKYGTTSVTGSALILAGLPVGLLDTGLVVRVVVVEQDTVGGAVQVVVLAAVDGPEEQPDGQADHDDGHGDHVVEGCHGNLRKCCSGGCRGRMPGQAQGIEHHQQRTDGHAQRGPGGGDPADGGEGQDKPVVQHCPA